MTLADRIRQLFIVSGATSATRSCFDEASYRAAAAQRGIAVDGTAFRHYRRHGRRVGLPPNDWFDAARYLAQNPDVAGAGIDAFEHYCIYGRREGRALGFATATTTFDRVVDAAEIGDVPRNPMRPGLALGTPAIAAAACRARSCGTGAPLVVSISHLDPVDSVGGVQLVAGIEQAAFTAAGVDHVSVTPASTSVTLAPPDEDTVLALRVNGAAIDVAVTTTQLAATIAAITDEPPVIVVVHSLFGHEPGRLGAALDALGARRHLWFVHDFSHECVNPTLTLNDTMPCFAPPVASMQCRTCRYGAARVDHVRRVGQLLESARWQVVAPSEAAADACDLVSSRLGSRPQILPHVTLVPGPHTRSFTGPVRIAFLGHPVPHKGWSTFVRLAERRHSPDVEFLHFAVDDPHTPHVRFETLAQRADDRHAARRLLVEQDVDAVVVWPAGSETFSFVTHEALAAGCIVIAPAQSGNVAPAATAAGLAIVHPDGRSLLDDDSLVATLLARRHEHRPICDLVWTGTAYAEWAGHR